MDFLHEVWLKLNLDAVIIAIVILSGFFQEKYLCHFSFSKDSRFDASLKTLAVSLFVSLTYIALIYDRTAPMPVAKYFISFFTATSLYDLIIRPIRIAIRKYAKKKLDLTDDDFKEADQNKQP